LDILLALVPVLFKFALLAWLVFCSSLLLLLFSAEVCDVRECSCHLKLHESRTILAEVYVSNLRGLEVVYYPVVVCCIFWAISQLDVYGVLVRSKSPGTAYGGSGVSCNKGMSCLKHHVSDVVVVVSLLVSNHLEADFIAIVLGVGWD
jgi:hypothetical protein